MFKNIALFEMDCLEQPNAPLIDLIIGKTFRQNASLKYDLNKNLNICIQNKRVDFIIFIMSAL